MKRKNINAFIIGFMAGILIYGVTNNTAMLWGLLPSIFIYFLVNKDTFKKDFERGASDAYKD